MINEVRQVVLALLSKNNFGYLSPSDFNGYARQAQLEIFVDYFKQYNQQINKENARLSGTEFANLSKIITESIEIFSVTNFLTQSSENIFTLPSLVTTGDDWYFITKILCYPTELSTGTSTSVVANQLVSTNGAFVSIGVAAGDIVVNQATGAIARVTSVVSSTVLALSANIFPLTSTVYMILDESSVKEAEKVSHSKITQLNTSLLTTPNATFPAYTQQANVITLFPTSINDKGKVVANYVRYPATPAWTYSTLSGGEPIFNASQSDYQDFEIPQDEEVNLIIKILSYAGLEIREAEVVNFSLNEEAKENAK